MRQEQCRKIGENYKNLLGAVEHWKWLLSSGGREKDRRKFIRDGMATQDSILFLINSVDQETGLRLSTRRIEKRLAEIKKELRLDVNLGVDYLTVYFRGGLIKDDDLQCLRKIIEHEKNPIQYLHLTNCGMKHAFLTILMNALVHQHNRVIDLDLSMNDIGDRAMELIVKALKHQNNKIRNLKLSNNQIGKPGMELLADALKDPNNKLVMIGLRNNRVSPEVVKDLLEEAALHTGRNINILF
jgi:hypothetical protein